MNDSKKSKESEVTASSNSRSDGKKNAYDDDQVLSTNPTISSSDDLTASNRTVLNGKLLTSVAKVTTFGFLSFCFFLLREHSTYSYFFVVVIQEETAASSSLLNTTRSSSHGQSHSKRHIRRPKSYRKESKAKSHASRNNVVSGNSINSSTGDGGIEPQDFFRNATSGATPGTLDITTRSIATKGSKDTLDERLERLSSRLSTSSSSSDNWDNSSSASSSDGASVIDEKSSSIELMAFTFDGGEGVRHSTQPNEAQKWRETLNTSSPDAMAVIQTSDHSTEQSKSTFASDKMIETRAVAVPVDPPDRVSMSIGKSSGSIRTDDSVLASVESESTASKISNSAGSKVSTGLEGADSNSMKKSNHSRSDTDEYSWISLNDSLNAVSPRKLSDALKRVESQESRGFYAYSNSTISNVSENTSNSKSEISNGTDGVLGKYSESLAAIPEVVRGSADPRVSRNSDRSPFGSPSTQEDVAIIRNVETPSRSTLSTSVLLPSKRDADDRIADKTDESFRLTLSLDSSSSSCSSGLSKNMRNDIHNTTNPFYQKRINDVTLSIPGDKPERCDLPVQSLAAGLLPDDHVSESKEQASPEHSKNGSHDAKVKNTLRPSPPGRVQNSSYSEEVLANLGPTVRDSLIRTEASTTTEADTAGHTLAPNTDLEENCNASSSFNVFTPFINFRKTIGKVVPSEDGTPILQVDQSLNVTTTEDSLYIMEGFGFLKTNGDDISDLEDEITDRRRDVGFDYFETENYPGYPPLIRDHDSGLKITDQIEFEGELPVIKQGPLTLELKENPEDRYEDPWWLNLDETKRKIERSSNDKDTANEMGVHSSGFSVLQEIRAFQSPSKSIFPEINLSNTSSYHLFLLPTLYIFIGMCIVVVGCSIWCSKVLVRRQQPKLPNFKYFIKPRGTAANAVV
ncbi:serine-rich adhesin for platelets-like isoform X2 [Athalia rosae]|nr:serine-rich adhesin for platelets-like isoform X2 [Athalia rosae]